MSSATAAPRWALSLADLSLVLLAFFVMLHAQSGGGERLSAGLRAAFGNGSAKATTRLDLAASALFEPGEAVLKPSEIKRLQGIGRNAARSGAMIRIESVGTDRSPRRFDRWELAAARVAAIARTLKAGGIDERRVDISIPSMAEAEGKGQHLSITVRPAKAP